MDEVVSFEEGEEYKNNESGYSEIDYDKTVDSGDDYDSLEEALKSNDNLPSVAFISHNKKEPTTLARPQMLNEKEAAESLIATHKSIMSKLLLMLQVGLMEAMHFLKNFEPH